MEIKQAERRKTMKKLSFILLFILCLATLSFGKWCDTILSGRNACLPQPDGSCVQVKFDWSRTNVGTVEIQVAPNQFYPCAYLCNEKGLFIFCNQTQKVWCLPNPDNPEQLWCGLIQYCPFRLNLK